MGNGRRQLAAGTPDRPCRPRDPEGALALSCNNFDSSHKPPFPRPSPWGCCTEHDSWTAKSNRLIRMRTSSSVLLPGLRGANSVFQRPFERLHVHRCRHSAPIIILFVTRTNFMRGKGDKKQEKTRNEKRERRNTHRRPQPLDDYGTTRAIKGDDLSRGEPKKSEYLTGWMFFLAS